VDVNEDRLDCAELGDPGVAAARAAAWQRAVDANGGLPPEAAVVTDRVLTRMRATALPALLGGGMSPG